MESYEQARGPAARSGGPAGRGADARNGWATRRRSPSPGGIARADSAGAGRQAAGPAEPLRDGRRAAARRATAAPEALMQEAVERVGAAPSDGRRAGRAAREDHPHRRLRRRPLPRRRRRRGARDRAREHPRRARGNARGFGTGSLVSPALLLTNHHVLPDADDGAQQRRSSSTTRTASTASRCRADLPARSRPLLPRRRGARLRARRGARRRRSELAPFGYNRLIEAEGKAIIGEYVTIVQHPRGEKKQIALRENKIVDIPDRFLHYAADTEPGSSGSPVFNDQWEVVALHHASVRRARARRARRVPQRGDPDQPHPRSSSRSRRCSPGGARAGRRAVRRAEADAGAAAGRAGRARRRGAGRGPGGGGRRGRRSPCPVEITRAARRRDRHRPQAAPPPSPRRSRSTPTTPTAAATTPASSPQPLPLPVPGRGARAAVASGELRYHHFSVVMHRERALALFTAVNIDGKLSPPARRASATAGSSTRGCRPTTRPARPSTRQPARPRPPRAPARPGLGHRRRAVKAANDDTFHFTNCHAAAPRVQRRQHAVGRASRTTSSNNAGHRGPRR